MKRSTWISVVDALAFITFVFLIGTGFLLKYVLPPGSGGLGGPGMGWRAASRPVALVWGLTRHEWGAIHFGLSVGFLAVMALHLLIHWRWIVVSFRGRDAQGTRLQVALGVAAVLGVVALAVAPLFSPKETVPRSELPGFAERQEQLTGEGGAGRGRGPGGGRRHRAEEGAVEESIETEEGR